MGTTHRSKNDPLLITEALAALRKATTADDGNTINELSASSGRGIDWIRRSLRLAKDRNILLVGRRPSTTLDGRTYNAVVYRIKP